jgi:hypothetical protein
MITLLNLLQAGQAQGSHLVTVSPSSTVLATSTAYTITLIPLATLVLPTTSTFELTFPNAYSDSSFPNPLVCETLLPAGKTAQFACTRVGLTVTLSQWLTSSSSLSSYSFRLQNIVNPGFATTTDQFRAVIKDGSTILSNPANTPTITTTLKPITCTLTL